MEKSNLDKVKQIVDKCGKENAAYLNLVNENGFMCNVESDSTKTIFTDETYNFGRAFLNSVIVTVAVTIYQLVITTLAAYALSKKTLPGRGFLNFFVIFTMYFGGGLIPYYIVIRNLQLLDTIWVLIIP